MLNEIINELGDNYNTSDNSVLETILDEVTANALAISNREDTIDNKLLLKQEIKNGKAQILCTIDGKGPKYYDCEIEVRSSAYHNKVFTKCKVYR